MKKYWKYAVLCGLSVGLLTACGSEPAEKSTNEEPVVIETEKVVETPKDDEEVEEKSSKEVTAPSFEIAVELSDKAKEKLEKTKETIIVDVLFTGEPKSRAKVELTEDGQYILASSTKEIKPGELATFKNIKISQEMLDNLTDKDFEVAVNVYTGRRVFQNNLISVDGVFGKISEFKGKKITLEGKLIQGE